MKLWSARERQTELPQRPRRGKQRCGATLNGGWKRQRGECKTRMRLLRRLKLMRRGGKRRKRRLRERTPQGESPKRKWPAPLRPPSKQKRQPKLRRSTRMLLPRGKRWLKPARRQRRPSRPSKIGTPGVKAGLILRLASLAGPVSAFPKSFGRLPKSGTSHLAWAMGQRLMRPRLMQKQPSFSGISLRRGSATPHSSLRILRFFSTLVCGTR
mmetsp:Transcript_13972/g.34159  ORF Transcript_13972/g.34159 Transcript_13972/m.34159 type:complete len:212 (+) Transcript_13972:1560-2195(+)